MTHPPGRDLLDRSSTGGGIRWRRYTAGVRMYDAVSLEWPIDGAGRREGIRLLAPVPGEQADAGIPGTGASWVERPADATAPHPVTLALSAASSDRWPALPHDPFPQHRSVDIGHCMNAET